MQLRIAEPSDAAAIRDLTREAYAKWVGVTGREPLPMMVDYEDAVRSHRFDLLEIDGRLAALIETTPQDAWLLIVNMAVRPEFQGRGLGRRLLALAEDLAVAAGVEGTRLYTNRLFAENVAFYLSLGYRVEREEALNGGIAVHMAKSL